MSTKYEPEREELVMGPVSSQPQRRWHLKNIHIVIFIIAAIYVLVLIALGYLWYKEHPALVTGLIIGAIFVFVTGYYFYDTFIVPYRQERAMPRGGYQNIYVWMVQWIVPTLFLQAFVILGFWVSIERVPIMGDVYTSAYKYGLIYKHYNSVYQSTGSNLRLSKEDFKQYVSEKKLQEKLKKVPIEIDYEAELYKIPFYIAFAFSFLGTLIYTLQDLSYRFFTSDLYAKTLVRYVIRFLIAPSFCIVLAYYAMNDWWVNAAPVVFFLVGLFPHMAVKFVEEKARNIFQLKKEETVPLPLGRLEGMTEYIIYRFREIGIDDAQNLAFVDLSYLRNNMGYSDGLLCDFVAQAMLLIYLRDEFSKLQAFSIRDIIAFQHIVTEDNYQEKAQAMGIPKEKLRGLLDLLKEEIVINRINSVKTCMVHSEQVGRLRRAV
jgi:hypothetical protein